MKTLRNLSIALSLVASLLVAFGCNKTETAAETQQTTTPAAAEAAPAPAAAEMEKPAEVKEAAPAPAAAGENADSPAGANPEEKPMGEAPAAGEAKPAEGVEAKPAEGGEVKPAEGTPTEAPAAEGH